MPSIRRAACLIGLAAPLLLAASHRPAAGASPIQLLSADDSGVTLQLLVERYALGAPGGDGRSELQIPQLELLAVPGRPRLPFATALIAVPQGATATAAVIAEGAEEAVDGVRISIGDRPVVRPDPDGVGYLPAREPVEPILDGAWPLSPAEVGEPFTLRRQRVAVVILQPFRYDAAASRLWTRRTLTVRVTFRGATAAPAGLPAEDRGFEPVLRSTVLNYEQGRRWREPRPALGRGLFDRPRVGPAGATGVAALDEDDPEVRVRIPGTGAWALDATELLAKGYPASVPVAEVSVHRHEFLPGIAAPGPPYATFEVPVEVDDLDNDGFFTAGDRIVLFAQNWWERSGLAYALPLSQAQRNWGDADYVYATRVRSPRQGLRILPRSGWYDPTPPPPQLANFPYRQRWERNTSYWGQPRDTTQDAFPWVQRPLYYNRSDSIRFETYDLDNTVTASVGVTWTGLFNTLDHFVWAAVKNAAGQMTTVVDSARASGKVTVTRRSTVFGSALSEGLTNRFIIWGKRFNAPPNTTNNYFADIALNLFEVSYARHYRAVQGYLPCNNGSASGDYEILATRFTDPASLRVYDVTDSSAVRRLTGVQIGPDGNGGIGVRFRDGATPGAQRRYLVFDNPRRLASTDYGTVDRAAITGLYDRLAGDYLLIVPEAFAGAMGPLVSLRRSQGLDVVVAPLEAVNDVFNGGRKSPWAIKRFIRHAYDNWDARFVLLVGDGSEDPQLVSPFSSKDWVPTQRIVGPVIASGPQESFGEAVVSDPWYVWCVTCANPQLAPKVPDLHIGRLPVNSLQEAAAVVNKLVSYENVAPDQAWRRKMVLLSDDLYSGVTFSSTGETPTSTYCTERQEDVFRQINERCRSIILDEAGLGQSEPEVFNLSYYVPIAPADTLPCPQPIYRPPAQKDTCRCRLEDFVRRARQYAQPALFSRLAEGRLWWNFQGHANPRVLSHEGFYANSYLGYTDDHLDLQNYGRPFLFTAFSCHPNAFGQFREGTVTIGGPALGEDLVTLPDRGAIASWASSAFESLPTSNSRHINVSFARALFADPPRDPQAFDPTTGARVVLGEVISKAEIDYFPGPPGSPSERDVAITYNLLGDPATRISIGSPQAIFFANQNPITDGEPVRLSTFSDTLRLEGDLVSNARIDSIWIERIQGGATTVIPAGDYTLTPAYPDTTDASGGGRRYRVVYRTSLTPGSYTFRFRSLDRYGVPGRFDAVFKLQTTLLAEGGVVKDGDSVEPTPGFSLLLLSPTPIVPANDLALRLNGRAVSGVSAVPANGDLSGREWTVTWAGEPYADGSYRLEVLVQGLPAGIHSFQVTSRLRIQNAFAFPNPFHDEGGTVFSFYLESDRPSKVMVRVYAISGRMIYERTLDVAAAGYQQIAWNGIDAEGRTLANGVYFYRLAADNGVASSRHEGRLVKVTRPNTVPEEQSP